MTSSPSIRWFFLQKILFRILFIYFVLFATNWIGFFSFIPGVTFLTGLWEQAEIWMVQLFNNLLWHLKDEVAPAYNGSGDSSYSWAYLYTMIFLSVVGGIIWSVVDWKRPNYINLDFWLRNLVRYTVALWAFYYGIIKIFALQMPFPNLSLLATPLGDLLPMRLSWMFIGYSVPYQFFSGLMEVLVGIFLFFRPTITLGALMGVGVFANVAMLNLSYDIPVKIFSLQLLFCCLYLSSNDWLRVLQFFFFNQATKPDHSYQMNLRQPWHRIAHIVAKLAFVGVFMAMPFFQSLTRYQTKGKVTVQKPFTPGVYQVQSFVRNRDTIPFTIADSTHWKDMIFNEDGARASINSNDTLFFQRYRRGYFSYQVDTAKKTMSMKKTPADTAAFLTMQYQILSPGKIRLWTVLRGDSLNMVIQRSKRHFQLTERQFHWVSEENR